MSDEQTISVGINRRTNDDIFVPVVELLTGRGFITGKSGSGKSNTASVVAEKLLDSGFGLLIVDVDGEYYGLKEEYEILHAGADEECDIQVVPEHAEKLASLALEQNVPIILDVSGYLDQSVAEELLLETTRQLFAKEKKLKKPFLLLIEECHEYIPEGGGLGEVGKMLIKVGKRGRKHGLGVVGISQRPADVKKDFITQCDWLCWHRLTWDNDTKVVGRILGSDYANAVEDLDDGEAFLMTDWEEEIQRVQFHRKETFDAGATPGLDDFERPELKSVSGNLVSELQEISEEQKNRESELADLRQELDKKRQRIAELEGELAEAKDLSRMADSFAQAMLQKADASYRGGNGATPAQRERQEYERTRADRRRDGENGTATTPEPAARESTRADSTDEERAESSSDSREERATDSKHRTIDESSPESTASATNAERTDSGSSPESTAGLTASTVADSSAGGLTAEKALSRLAEDLEVGTREAVVQELRGRIESLDRLPGAMLDHYRREGVSEPIEAHIDAGGDADRNVAYSRNRQLRRAGLIRHAGEGAYAYAVPDLIREAYDDRLDEETISAMRSEIEQGVIGDAKGSATPERTPSVSDPKAESEIDADD